MAAAPSAIVLGASIAGLAAAISLLRRGFAVTVFEHAERGAPGGAGLALTHATLLQLHELGVSVPTAAIEEQCVLLGDEVLRRRAICSHAVRWSELRDALLRAAEACGATVQHGVRATGYTPTPDGAVQFGGKRFDVVPAALGRFEEARRPPADAACLLSRRIGSVRQGGHGPIASAEALTEMSGDASTAHRSPDMS